MKKKLCGFFTKHALVKESTEEDGGGSRFVDACLCGERIQKSVPYVDNDFLANIKISKYSYFIDEEASTYPEK